MLAEAKHERIANFFSMEGGFTRFLKWLVILWCFLIAPLGLAAKAIYLTVSYVPQPEQGKTYSIMRNGHAVYVTAQAGHFQELAFAIFFNSFGALGVLIILGLIARRIFGDPRRGPDLRGSR